MSKKKIAIIGCGNIAEFHIPALREAGLECVHCSSSLNSKTIDQFAARHKIDKAWTDPKKLAMAKDQWDGMVIAASVEPTLDLLKIVARSGKPVLVEKPVATSSERLAEFSTQSPSNIIVAYNRRYYNTVQKAREFAANKMNLRAIMTLPENVSSEFRDPYFLVHENSVHGFDILGFIFGKVSVEHVATASADNPYFGRHVILKSSAGHLINLIMNWKAPSNFTLSLDDAKHRLDLFPFEKFQLYDGMKVIEPSDKYPVRQYVPNQVDSGTVFDNMPPQIKPGFLGQALEFKNLIDGKLPTIGANMTDAYNAQVIAEQILNNGKP